MFENLNSKDPIVKSLFDSPLLQKIEVSEINFSKENCGVQINKSLNKILNDFDDAYLLEKIFWILMVGLLKYKNLSTKFKNKFFSISEALITGVAGYSLMGVNLLLR